MTKPTSDSDMNTRCRICLLKNANLLPINEPLYQHKNISIYDALCSIVNKKISTNKMYPQSVCVPCLSSVNTTVDMIKKYKRSELTLLKYAKSLNCADLDKSQNETTNQEEPLSEFNLEFNKSNVAPVQLITKLGTYNIQDLVIVEEDEDDVHNFEGFLNNLGKEISANFVKENTKSNECCKPDADEESNTLTIIKTLNYDDVFGKSGFLDELSDDEEIWAEEEAQQNENIKSERHDVTVPAKELKKTKKIACDEIKYTCKLCKKTFKTLRNMTRHNLEIHQDCEESHLCQICGNIAKSKTALYNHMHLKHREKKYACTLCDKKYFSSTNLKTHLAVHENKRLYLCTICGKGFNYAVALEYHMRLHTGEKKYECTFCDRTFSMKCGLDRHLRTHTGARPYRCRYCDKGMRSKGELDCHEWTHTGYRPYHCKYCDKGFTKTHNLKMHMLGHKGPHECEICHRGFLEMNYLKMHMKISHKITG